MQKMIAVMDTQVKDLSGLYVELRKQSFDVLNVGSDQAGTYVYLNETEVKDPTPLVEEWADKPAPQLTKGEVRKRKEEIEKVAKPKPAPVAVLLPQAVEPPLPAVDTTPAASPEAEVEPAPKKEGLLKRLLKKILS